MTPSVNEAINDEGENVRKALEIPTFTQIRARVSWFATVAFAVVALALAAVPATAQAAPNGTVITDASAHASVLTSTDQTYSRSNSAESVSPLVWRYYASYTNWVNCDNQGRKGFGRGWYWITYECYLSSSNPVQYDLYVDAYIPAPLTGNS